MYSHIFVAGTFDKLHLGHKHLLFNVFTKAKTVTIGVTSERFVAEYKKESLMPYPQRKEKLEKWLQDEKLIDRAIIIPIHDPYEPLLSSTLYQAVAVTEQNRSRAEEINRQRPDLNLPPLDIIEIPLLPAVDGKPISATRVRLGEIDIFGNLVLPPQLRPDLVGPLGRILTGEDEITKSLHDNRDRIIVTVGDETTKKIIQQLRHPELGIVDLMVRRQPKYTAGSFGLYDRERITKLKSGPGFISRSAIREISRWAGQLEKGSKPVLFLVTGEEDLLVLPAVFFSPTGSVLYYGQPPTKNRPEIPSGMVEVMVTTEMKAEVKALLKRFTMGVSHAPLDQ